MISAGHIERAFECESSGYENCSSIDDSLGTDAGHLPMKPYIMTDRDRQQQTVNSGLSKHYF